MGANESSLDNRKNKKLAVATNSSSAALVVAQWLIATVLIVSELGIHQYANAVPFDHKIVRFNNWIRKGFLFEDFNQWNEFRADYYDLHIESNPDIVKWRKSPEASLYFDNIVVFNKIDQFFTGKRICYRDNIASIKRFVDDYNLESFMADRSATAIDATTTTLEPVDDQQQLAFKFAPIVKVYLYLVADKCFDLLTKNKIRLEKADNDPEMIESLDSFRQFIESPDGDLSNCRKAPQANINDDYNGCTSKEEIDLNEDAGRNRFTMKLSNFLDFGQANPRANLCSSATKSMVILTRGQERQNLLNWNLLTGSCMKLERWYKNTIDPISLALSMTANESQLKYLRLLKENPDYATLRKWSEISAWCNIILRTEVSLNKIGGLRSSIEKQIKIHALQLPIDESRQLQAYVWNDSLKYLSLTSLQQTIFWTAMSGLALGVSSMAIATGGVGLVIRALAAGTSAIILCVASSVKDSIQNLCG